MPKPMKNRPRGLMLLAALAILLVFSIRLSSVTESVERSLLLNRWQEKMTIIDLLCDEVDEYVRIDHDWGEYDYATPLSDSMTRVDNSPGVYAALFSSDLELLSYRIVMEDETELNPLLEPDFHTITSLQDFGEMEIKHSNDIKNPEAMLLYFRWIPTETESQGKLLAVVAMSESALVESPVNEMLGWCVALLCVAALALVVAVVAITSKQPEGSFFNG